MSVDDPISVADLKTFWARQAAGMQNLPNPYAPAREPLTPTEIRQLADDVYRELRWKFAALFAACLASYFAVLAALFALIGRLPTWLLP